MQLIVSNDCNAIKTHQFFQPTSRFKTANFNVNQVFGGLMG